MPYGEKSAYAAQAALKKKSPAYMKSSGFKMKGSPLNQNNPPEKYSNVIKGDTKYRYNSKGEEVATFRRNPKHDPKDGSPSAQSVPQWILNK